MKHANRLLVAVVLLLLAYVGAYAAMVQTVDLGETPTGPRYGRRYRIRSTAVQFLFFPLRAMDERLRGKLPDLDQPENDRSPAPLAPIPVDEKGLPSVPEPPSGRFDPYR